MLKKVTIKNYRRFLDETLNFDDIVLIAGKNGTGKSSLVELIYKIKRFLTSEGQDGYVESLVSWSDLPRWEMKDYGKVETSFSLVLECENSCYAWDLTTQYNLRDLKCRIIMERLTLNADTLYHFDIENDNAQVFSDDKKEFHYPVDWGHSNLRIAGRVNSKIRAFLDEVGGKIVVHSLLPEYLKDGEGDFDFHGNNFSAWFSEKLAQDIESTSAVLQLYKDFLPNCVRTSISTKNGEIIINERKGAGASFELHFSELSAGQKKLCIYYALFKTVPYGATLILDEFENHLSPVELIPLYQMVQEEQETKWLQIIIVSHHNKTLNWYNDAVRIFSLVGEPAHVKIIEKDENSTVLEMLAGSGE
jgi:ABC-type molybdenum transport system ATPase subunit/photorepair protein PhrA